MEFPMVHSSSLAGYPCIQLCYFEFNREGLMAPKIRPSYKGQA